VVLLQTLLHCPPLLHGSPDPGTQVPELQTSPSVQKSPSSHGVKVSASY
jgi:hypothetical protein